MPHATYPPRLPGHLKNTYESSFVTNRMNEKLLCVINEIRLESYWNALGDGEVMSEGKE